jgi:lysylphosphatidylglycerol synthetase-like protein (DUF2156 family)
LLAQVPTVVLGVLIIMIAALFAMAGVAFTQRRITVDQRKNHTTGLNQINGVLGAMFGVIVGFSAFLVLNKYHTAQETVQGEAGDVEEIYRLAEPLTEPERGHIQGLATSYARLMVEEEWPLMRQGKTSPRADALAEELRGSIQQGYKTSTGAEQEFFGQELAVVNDLDEHREVRLLAVHQRLPSILWAALVVLATLLVVFSYLVGMESSQLHVLTVAALATGIALVLFTIGILDRPFGTDFRVGPQPFELVLDEIGGRGG